MLLCRLSGMAARSNSPAFARHVEARLPRDGDEIRSVSSTRPALDTLEQLPFLP